MRTRRSFILFYCLCAVVFCISGCWESIRLDAEVEIRPEQVRRGESVSILAASKQALFLDTKVDIAFSPGDGLKTGALKRQSAQNLQIPLEIAEDAALGPRVLTLTVGELTIEKEIEVLKENASSDKKPASGGDTAGEDDGRLLVSPSRVSRGEQVTFRVTGKETNFSAETTVSFGPDSDIEIGEIEIQSSTALSFDATVSMAAIPGIRTLYVSGPAGQTVEVLAVDIEVLAAVTCYVDVYEVNNTIGQASPVNFPSTGSASICAGDHDYFKVNIQAGVAVDFFIQFAHNDGDLDMELLTLQGQLLATSFSRTDNELITFTAPEHQSGERVLHIFGHTNAVNNYTFTADVAGIHTCVDDAREPNDYFNAAIPVSFPDSFAAMICSNDDDYFSVQVPGAMTIEISALFSHSAGDLNLALLSSTEQILAVSESEDDNEELFYTTSDDGLQLPLRTMSLICEKSEATVNSINSERRS